jgi:hypothetical protein
MRFIPTRVHGYMDYLIGMLLIAAPWVLGFADGGGETWIPVLLGASVIVYSLLTDYELGATKLIDMKSHLWLDGVGGAFLAISPWVFNFDERVWLPHVAVGLLEVGTALFTQTRPGVVRRTDSDILPVEPDTRVR